MDARCVNFCYDRVMVVLIFSGLGLDNRVIVGHGAGEEALVGWLFS